MASRPAIRSLIASRSRSRLPPPLILTPARLSRLHQPTSISRSLASTSRSLRNAYTSDSPQLPPPPSTSSASNSANVEVGGEKQKIGQVEPRLSLTFTCTAPLPDSSTASKQDGGPATGGEERTCGHRSTHEFSKKSYDNGIVLIQCPSCKSRHLIADHLGWFKESTEEGKHKTVEDLLRAKGEKVTRGRVNFDGDIEYDGTP